MKLNCIIFLFLVLTSFTSKSQEIIDSTFLRSVAGQTLEQFSFPSIESTEKLGLTDITSSPFDIEIRLFETYVMLGVTYCTTLYLDTTFKLSRTKYLHNQDNSNRELKEANPINALKVDSILKVLVKNRIFNFTNQRNATIST